MVDFQLRSQPRSRPRTCAHVRECDPDLLASSTEARVNLARLFAYTALLVFGAVTLAWWGLLAWLIWHVI